MRSFHCQLKRRCCAAVLTIIGLSAPGFASPQAPVSAPDAIGFSGAMPDLGAVEVENGHVYDYTFSSAPVDWKVQSGIWEMTNRWDCSPGWSWFGGRSEEIAAIWNKRKFSGDFSVQFYFAFKMGFIKEAKTTWHYHPANVAISFCGDGKNFGSGYSFIIGADNNEHSTLLKKGRTVADSRAPEALLYSLADGYPASEKLHRRWWYVKVNKIGNRVECWLDNKLVFTYDDPKALDAGQFALWTYNNGIMLSRVQIFYENEVKTSSQPRILKKIAASNTQISRGAQR